MACVGGDAGKQRLKAKMLECMQPPETPSQTLTEFQLLLKTDEYKFSDRATQAKFDTMRKIIGRIVDQRPPEAQDASEDDMLKDLVALIPSYLAVDMGQGDNKKTVHGAAALAYIYSQVKKKADDGTASFNDVAPFAVYLYLASKGEQAKYRAMVDSVVAKCADFDTKRPSKKAKSASSSGLVASERDAAVKSAMAMFA